MSSYVVDRDGGKTNEQGLNESLNRLFTKGVPSIDSSSSLQVSQRGAGANMSVDVAVGDCQLVRPDGLYSYWGWTDAVTNVAISAANPSNPRIDVVAAYVDLSVTSTTSNNNPGALKFSVIAGIPAGSPTVPTSSTIQAALGANVPWVGLANVAVAAGATQIVTANVTDVRQPISVKTKLWGGGTNTNGHTVPNVADDTVALLAATQTFTNKTLTSPTLTNAVDNGTQLSNVRNETIQNFIASGGIVAISSGLVGTFSDIAYYVGGTRYTKTSVSNKTYTASKDTYVDVDPTNGSTVTYTEVANSATSPSLAANNIRVAVVVTSGSAITTINQGDPTAAAPVTSSVTVAVADSLGNVIYPRAGQRTLSYRQITSNQTGTNSLADITGLSALPFILAQPALVKFEFYCYLLTGNNASGVNLVQITDNSNNIIQIANGQNYGAQSGGPVYMSVKKYLTAGSYTYKLRGAITLAGTAITYNASSTNPTYFSVELA